MPETPDFEQIARELVPAIGPEELFPYRNTVAAVAEQFRLIWNARGAADIMKLEADLSAMMGVTAAGPYVKNLDRALRSLDR
jgi:hypothetical protein